MRIAITGGIAEGKSTILAHLERLGATVASADNIAKEILKKESIQTAIGKLAGEESTLAPEKIRLLLSLDDQFRRSLNKLLHPLVIAEIEDSSAQFVEVPLLFETCMHTTFDSIWVAYAGQKVQTERLTQRYPGKDIESLLETQLSSKVRLAFADAVIPTSTDQNSTMLAIEKEVKRWGIPLVVS